MSQTKGLDRGSSGYKIGAFGGFKTHLPVLQTRKVAPTATRCRRSYPSRSSSSTTPLRHRTLSDAPEALAAQADCGYIGHGHWCILGSGVTGKLPDARPSPRVHRVASVSRAVPAVALRIQDASSRPSAPRNLPRVRISIPAPTPPAMKDTAASECTPTSVASGAEARLLPLRTRHAVEGRELWLVGSRGRDTSGSECAVAWGEGNMEDARRKTHPTATIRAHASAASGNEADDARPLENGALAQAEAEADGGANPHGAKRGCRAAGAGRTCGCVGACGGTGPAPRSRGREVVDVVVGGQQMRCAAWECRKQKAVASERDDRSSGESIHESKRLELSLRNTILRERAAVIRTRKADPQSIAAASRPASLRESAGQGAEETIQEQNQVGPRHQSGGKRHQ
ncbi:hypothetical protein B0H17DRAFT_1289638 [Mycena rosella]|uniref:Uncharacterized protein n=1 Tax=Mycena rosella TaxID=1033263 RepID=A0AAD7DHQ6_MYCRO|nr:hypothetical protein B0H17DRAFT_1289638 [Mycena rosella]